MLKQIKTMLSRIEQRMGGVEREQQKLRQVMAHTEAEIAAAQRQKTTQQQHLALLTIAGKTCLEAIIENKARQGTIQRKLADITLMLSDKQQQLLQQKQQQNELKTQRNILQRKEEKFNRLLQQHLQYQQQNRQSQHDAEIEERVNWPT